jgi:hypothetical protein
MFSDISLERLAGMHREKKEVNVELTSEDVLALRNDDKFP